jgi:hypothetical protein
LIDSQQDLAPIDCVDDNAAMAKLRGHRSSSTGHRAAGWRIPVTLRLAGADDEAAVARLAQLDSRPVPAPPLLVAERAGRIEAAVSLSAGDAVADPFRRTAELVELLRCHAGGERLDRFESPEPAASARQVTDARPALAGGCP